VAEGHLVLQRNLRQHLPLVREPLHHSLVRLPWYQLQQRVRHYLVLHLFRPARMEESLWDMEVKL
jgi:hypothetical protein